MGVIIKKKIENIIKKIKNSLKNFFKKKSKGQTIIETFFQIIFVFLIIYIQAVGQIFLHNLWPISRNIIISEREKEKGRQEKLTTNIEIYYKLYKKKNRFVGANITSDQINDNVLYNYVGFFLSDHLKMD